MTTPDFTFNEKTGELSRGGKALVLSKLQREIFAVLEKAHWQGCRVSADHVSRCMGGRYAVDTIVAEYRDLAREIRPLGISIASDSSGLRWLVFGEPPKRREPTIPEPFRLEGERP